MGEGYQLMDMGEVPEPDLETPVFAKREKLGSRFRVLPLLRDTNKQMAPDMILAERARKDASQL